MEQVIENVPAGSTIGSFVSTDDDAGETFTYSLVPGTGDIDNSSFSIIGDELTMIGVPDYEAQDSYEVRVRSTDAGGLFIEKTFTVSVNDLLDNQAPDAVNDVAGEATVEEDDGSTDITLSVLANDSDPDGDSFVITAINDTTTLGLLNLLPSGAVTYDPNSDFESLGAGETATQKRFRTPLQILRRIRHGDSHGHDRRRQRCSDGGRRRYWSQRR